MSFETKHLDLETATLKLLNYCRENSWAGYEPYDALNSPLFSAVPILDSKIPRLVFTQALKRMPFNLRPLMLIRKTQNPKALGIFLSALLVLSRRGIAAADEHIDPILDSLTALRSTRTDYWCWGYSFPWQTRGPLVPRWAPNLVCTAFVAGALISAYEDKHEPRYLEMAVSAGEYLLKELYWHDGRGAAGFAYPLPAVRAQVHNANFLGAELLCRLYMHTRQQQFVDVGLKVARYSASQQRPDGSWLYGERATAAWIDNFHTGFNLSALKGIGQWIGTAEFDANIGRGLDFYRANFFLDDGSVRYYHNRTYPIDSHCIAQSIITLVDLCELRAENLSLAHSVCRWAMNHMWNGQGFFYYRKLRSCTIRTSYMRWTQAWMLLALSRLLTHSPDQNPLTFRSTPVEV